MNVEAKFRDNADAILSRILDPESATFSLDDAMALIGFVPPGTSQGASLPLVRSLDITPVQHRHNQHEEPPRLKVEHKRLPASGYWQGAVDISKIENNRISSEADYTFSYYQTYSGKHFMVPVGLFRRVDGFGSGWFKTPSSYWISKMPDRCFDAPGTREMFDFLLTPPGRPSIFAPLRGLNRPQLTQPV